MLTGSLAVSGGMKPAGPAGRLGDNDCPEIPEFGRWLGRGGGIRDGEVSAGLIVLLGPG